jgi:glycosyltransferase involved in cell wall biosynthesis
MDGKKALVSVVMSVYNSDQWLRAAIESILSQSYDNWEFIIVDDGSNAATKKILSGYSGNAKIKIISNEKRLGLTKNLNMAISLCKGEFIARMDADDICLPLRFEKQVNFLQNNPDVPVVCSFIDFIDENSNPVGIWKDDREANSWDKIKRRLPRQSCLAHPAVMVRKTIFEKYSYNERQSHSQDWDMWLQLAADGKIIEKINEPLLLYRVHQQSTTATSLKKSAFFKKHQTYQEYLKLVWRKRKFNFFNTKVAIAFLFNAIKLFLSRIKRTITS